jgi:hypothetical protein
MSMWKLVLTSNGGVTVEKPEIRSLYAISQEQKTLEIGGEIGSLGKFGCAVRVRRQPQRGKKGRLHLAFKTRLGYCRSAYCGGESD